MKAEIVALPNQASELELAKKNIFLQSLSQHYPEFLQGRKEKPLAAKQAAVVATAWPNARNQQWKHIRPERFFENAVSPVLAKISAVALEKFRQEVANRFSDSPNLMVFGDGRFLPELSRLPQSEESVTVKALNAWEQGDFARWNGDDGEGLKNERAFVEALGEAFWKESVAIKITAQAKVSLHAVFLFSEEGKDKFFAPAISLWVDRGAVCEWRETIDGGEAEGAVINLLERVQVAEGAQLFHARTQQRKTLASTTINVARDAQYKGLYANLGNAHYTKNIVVLNLLETGAVGKIYSLSHLKEEEVGENNFLVRHQAPHTESLQFVKNLLADASHGVYQGGVFVAPKVSPIVGEQLNKNLLVGDKAKVSSEPLLEIYSNDVKCKHGASVGQMREEELFYLQSRGLSLSKANDMLSEGFLSEVVLEAEFSEEMEAALLKEIFPTKI